MSTPDNTEESDYLKEIAPRLFGKIEKGSAATRNVPPAYFDAFPAKMMERIRREEETRKGNAAGHMRLLNWRNVGIAASLALLLGLLPFLKNQSPDGQAKNPVGYDQVYYDAWIYHDNDMLQWALTDEYSLDELAAINWHEQLDPDAIEAFLLDELLLTSTFYAFEY